jgi:hypothetical protein
MIYDKIYIFYLIKFLGAFAKLRKATISFVMYVCPHGTSRLPLDVFLWNLSVFRCKPDFQHPSRPVLGAHPVSYTVGTGSVPGGKAARAWRWPPNPSRAEVKEKVELYLYSPPPPPALRGLLKGQRYHRSDCRQTHTLMYAYIISRTVLTCDTSAGPLTLILLQ